MFKPSKFIHPCSKYQKGGSLYNKKSSQGILYGTVCLNCGYPYGVHNTGGTECIKTKSYKSWGIGEPIEPFFGFKNNLLKKIKLL